MNWMGLPATNGAKYLPKLGCWMALKDPCVKGLVPRVVILGGGGTLGKWGLVGGP